MPACERLSLHAPPPEGTSSRAVEEAAMASCEPELIMPRAAGGGEGRRGYRYRAYLIPWYVPKTFEYSLLAAPWADRRTATRDTTVGTRTQKITIPD